MPGGGSQDVKQTTTVELTPEQKQLIKLAMPFANQFAANPPPAPTGSQIAPFNPTQQTAQGLAIASAIPQSQIAANAAGTQGFLSHDVLTPESNPALQGYIKAATDPLVRNATENLLPAVRGDFVNAGQYGSSRQGIAERGVASDTLRQVGDTTAGIANTAYGQGLEAMTKGLALSPTTAALQSVPASTVGAVGDVQRSMTQALLSEAYQNQQLSESWPGVIAREILGLSTEIPGGGTQTVANQPSAGGLQSAIGLASGILPLLFAFM